MLLMHVAAMTAAVMIDRVVGDPPNWPHPVRWTGSLISILEKRLNRGRHRRLKGVIHLLVTLLTVGFSTMAIVYFAYQLHWAAGFVIEVLLITSAIAQKSLKTAALEVVQPLERQDIALARKRLSWIVGRDTEHLTESQIVRGTIETVAENTSDGITAPLFWAFIGGAPAIWVYKAINTGDSIIGYRNKRFEEYGWATAKLDDAANWIPSRITGWIMLITRRPASSLTRKKLARLLPGEAKKHPSPNSGWGEAAVALMLNIKLGGRNTYQGIVSDRPVMGVGSERLLPMHVHQAVQMMNRSVLLFMAVCWLGGIIYVFTGSWS
ncbi:cobalamin biosynthesis protein CobD [Jeotgalibacillus sp. S-D1]|uniref:adenosylcobinamide-phosphate synthase CbiB n=1 Tax=Jeotgalibacillus sp. S-D1 TaxID=2552189 RepID=UPI001059F0A7|nr:adenosylcobinamide-phosphate synthase CbiB [Jeotgalibacillus sp. S-D1]TDL32978.1 cobalamin biosynthesis protein CobD [Jeotgalibacillus sp. S-D1]